MIISCVLDLLCLPISLMGCLTPISLFTVITDTKDVSVRMEASNNCTHKQTCSQTHCKEQTRDTITHEFCNTTNGGQIINTGFTAQRYCKDSCQFLICSHRQYSGCCLRDLSFCHCMFTSRSSRPFFWTGR